jgi:hypothetical protein
MTECESMQERMPLVAHGQSEWTGAELGHLAACPDCSAEWRLVQTAARLGGPAARRLDPGRISVAVLGQLAAARRGARWRRGGWLAGLAAAAVLVLMVWGGSHRRGATTGTPESPAANAQALHVPLAELENLDASELEAVLEGLDAPLGSQAAPDAPHLGDLNDDQLERVLRSLEG